MLNVLTKNSLKYGWVGTNRAHFEKQFRKKWRYTSRDDIIENLFTKVRVCHDLSATFLYFSLARPNKGEYSGPTNAEKCKL